MLRLRYVALLLVGPASVIAACAGKSDDASEQQPAAGMGGSSGAGAGKGGGAASGGVAGTSAGTAGASGSAARGGTGGGTGGAGGTVQGGGGSGAGGSSAASGGGSGGSADGGTGVGGENGGGTGGTTAGAAGTGMCGPCPGAACGPLFMAYVTAPSGGVITSLTAEATGLEIGCRPNGPANPGCQWVCESTNFVVGDGDYTVTFSAVGYEPTQLSFTVVTPTNCGCCGCPCHTESFNDVMLIPNGDAPGACCADLTSDASNCGSCGTECSTPFHCASGTCVGPQGT